MVLLSLGLSGWKPYWIISPIVVLGFGIYTLISADTAQDSAMNYMTGTVLLFFGGLQVWRSFGYFGKTDYLIPNTILGISLLIVGILVWIYTDTFRERKNGIILFLMGGYMIYESYVLYKSIVKYWAEKDQESDEILDVDEDEPNTFRSQDYGPR